MFSHAWESHILQQPQVSRRQVRRQGTKIRYHHQPFPDQWHWAMQGRRIETQWFVSDNICMTLYGLPPPTILQVGIPCRLKGVANTAPGATQNLPPVWVPQVTIALGAQGFRGWESGAWGLWGGARKPNKTPGQGTHWQKKGLETGSWTTAWGRVWPVSPVCDGDAFHWGGGGLPHTPNTTLGIGTP